MRVRTAFIGAVLATFGFTGVATVATAGSALSEQDRTWMIAAHQSNLAEIAAGQAAQAEATTDAVRSLGAMFIEMHTALDADLVAAAAQPGVALPDAPTPAQQVELEQVTAQEGDAFDAAWIAQQTAAHAASLAATDVEIQQGQNETVVGLATAARPVIESHLVELQGLAGDDAPDLVQTGSGGQAAAVLGDDGSSSVGWTVAVGAGAGALLLLGLRLRRAR